MKIKIALLLSFIVFSLFVTPIFAAVSGLNTEFNSSGTVPGITTSHGPWPDAGGEAGLDIALQEDGKILIVGTGRNELNTNYDLLLWRYNRDGSPDTTFSGDGIVTRGNIAGGNGNDRAQAMALQDDGKIVVVGSSHNGADYDAFIIRFNRNGSLDTTFSAGDGSDGYDVQDEGDAEEAYDVAIQEDGKIVMVGYENGGGHMAIWRYTVSGVLDTSFSGDGKDLSVDGIGAGIALQDDGKILVCGAVNEGTSEAGVARYRPNGTLDTTGFNAPFGYGYYVNDLGDDYCMSIAVDDDGKIYATGNFAWFFGAVAIGVARLNSDGIVDTTYGTDGLAAYNSDLDDVAYKVLLEGSKAYVAAATGGDTDLDFTLLKFDETGQLDTTLNDTGIYSYDSGGGADQAMSLLLEGDGNILITGAIMNAGTADMGLVNYYSAYQIDNLGTSIYATDENGNVIEDGFSYGVVGDGTVTLQNVMGSYLLAEVDAAFTDDLDWTGVNGNVDVSAKKSVIFGLDSAEGAESTHTLYVPKDSSDDAVLICPEAETLAEVSTTCEDREVYQASDSGVNTITVSGQDYWVVEGVSSSGGISGMYEELSETGDPVYIFFGVAVVLGLISIAFYSPDFFNEER